MSSIRWLTPALILLVACKDDGQDSPTLDTEGPEGCEAPATFYADLDGDGFGDPEAPYEAPNEAPNEAPCEAPEGYLSEAGDCDDANAAVHPDAEEVCNSVDDNCDGLVDVDASDAATWYTDADADGYGDDALATVSCEPPTGAVAEGGDCDDSDAAIHPGATEVCDGSSEGGVDDDCDGLIDDEDSDLDTSTASLWYADDDGDGYGNPNVSTLACEAPSGAVADDSDCDDVDAAVNPIASEVCNGWDDDCDGLIDDEDGDLDTSTWTTWYTDADADGYGDDGTASASCAAPTGAVSAGGDCADDDPGISPGETEVWYNGVDQDCDGLSDYDADQDGDDSDDYGGGDCDDTDATRYFGVDCRPEVSCTSPSVTTLTNEDPTGVADMVFIGDCEALLCTTLHGDDYARTIDSSGITDTFYGVGGYNIGSCNVDPTTGAVVVGYTSTQGVGYQSGANLPTVALSGRSHVTISSGPWQNGYMSDSPSAIEVDSAGSIWVPNWSSRGTLVELDASGNLLSSWVLGTGSLVSLDLDSAESVYVASADTIYLVDTSTGGVTSWYVASDDILDFTFDFNDDIYVETVDDVITQVEADLSAETVFQSSLTGDAKISISADGLLFRMIGDPTNSASYESYVLPN